MIWVYRYTIDINKITNLTFYSIYHIPIEEIRRSNLAIDEMLPSLHLLLQ